MRLPDVSLICAMTPQRVIGDKGGMPWHLPRDLKRFKKLTLGSAVVMGPRTFASIGKPLPGRLNIVLTTNHAYQAPGVLVAHDTMQALELAAIHGRVECFAVGGAMVYASFLPLARHLFVTWVWSECEGDTRFPHWNKQEWHEAWLERKWRKSIGDQFPTRFAEFSRLLPPPPPDTQINWRLPNE